MYNVQVLSTIWQSGIQTSNFDPCIPLLSVSSIFDIVIVIESSSKCVFSVYFFLEIYLKKPMSRQIVLNAWGDLRTRHGFLQLEAVLFNWVGQPLLTAWLMSLKVPLLFRFVTLSSSWFHCTTLSVSHYTLLIRKTLCCFVLLSITIWHS